MACRSVGSWAGRTEVSQHVTPSFDRIVPRQVLLSEGSPGGTNCFRLIRVLADPVKPRRKVNEVGSHWYEVPHRLKTPEPVLVPSPLLNEDRSAAMQEKLQSRAVASSFHVDQEREFSHLFRKADAPARWVSGPVKVRHLHLLRMLRRKSVEGPAAWVGIAVPQPPQQGRSRRLASGRGHFLRCRVETPDADFWPAIEQEIRGGDIGKAVGRRKGDDSLLASSFGHIPGIDGDGPVVRDCVGQVSVPDQVKGGGITRLEPAQVYGRHLSSTLGDHDLLVKDFRARASPMRREVVHCAMRRVDSS